MNHSWDDDNPKLCSRGCGRRVSENKSYCQACSEKTMTHIVHTIASQKVELLFRASDGIQIAVRQDKVVIFGAEPNKRSSHVFVDEAHASRFLRQKCAGDDLVNVPGGGTEIAIEEFDVESKVIMPADSFQLPLGISRMPGTGPNGR